MARGGTPSGTRTPHGPALSPDALNRALLARQHLLAPHDGDTLAEVRHLVGLQSQVPTTPYLGLHVRLAGFRPDALGTLLLDRHVVRLATVRSTVHLVAAEDALVFHALLRDVDTGYLRAANTHGAALRDVDLADLERAAEEILAPSPLTSVELGRRLAARWPAVDPKHLAYGARCLLPLVQVPPRGLWGASGAGTQTTWTTADTWLGRERYHFAGPGGGPDADPEHVAARAEVLRRYLRAFGPATVADAQRWSGLTRLRDAADALPELVTFTGPDGRRHLDVPGAPRPDAGERAPLVLVGPFDNLVLGHSDRTRVLAPEHRSRVVSVNGQVAAPVLVDGRVVGRWSVRRDGTAPDDASHLEVETFGHRLTHQEHEELAERAERLRPLLAPDLQHLAVRVSDA